MSQRDPLPEADIRANLPEGWEYDGDVIHTSYEFDGFRDAIAFLVRVAFECEQRNHHPELSNVYNEVEVSLSTHDAGGVTQLDLDLAVVIEELA
ncbi:MAG TPA: 4a-hydroxytetrahydrobiopterin dehydratase [Nitriliruptorales bacterium]